MRDKVVRVVISIWQRATWLCVVQRSGSQSRFNFSFEGVVAVRGRRTSFCVMPRDKTTADAIKSYATDVLL